MNVQVIFIGTSGFLALCAAFLSIMNVRLTSRSSDQARQLQTVTASRALTRWAIAVSVISILATGLAVAAISPQFRAAISKKDTRGTGPIAITSPANGSTVTGQGFPLRGTSHGLPPGMLLWSASKGEGVTDTYQPNDHPCAINLSDSSTPGQFDCGLFYLGGPHDHGKKFHIFLLTADARAVQDFLQYNANDPRSRGYPGMPALPPGTTVVAVITVVRQ